MNQLPEKTGKYPIAGIAGKGNMGIVYVGYDPLAERDVAIKGNSATVWGEDRHERLARKMFFNICYQPHTPAGFDSIVSFFTIIERLSVYGIAILKDVDANEPLC